MEVQYPLRCALMHCEVSGIDRLILPILQEVMVATINPKAVNG
jgi:hypothetical protein